MSPIEPVDFHGELPSITHKSFNLLIKVTSLVKNCIC